MSKFKEELTPSQMMSFEKEIRQNIFLKKALLKRRELILPEKTKRPQSAYLLYKSFQEANDESAQGKLRLYQVWKKSV